MVSLNLVFIIYLFISTSGEKCQDANKCQNGGTCVDNKNCDNMKADICFAYDTSGSMSTYPRLEGQIRLLETLVENLATSLAPDKIRVALIDWDSYVKFKNTFSEPIATRWFYKSYGQKNKGW